DPLLKARGVAVLETLLVLDAAERMSAARGLTINADDVEREYEAALRQLVTPLASISPPTVDRTEAERVLESVLAEKGLSRDEFILGIRRNAFLRAISVAEISVSHEQIQAEFQRTHGERILVRQIQVASLSDAAKVRERFASGEDFGALAVEFSAHTSSAKAGGLLRPFSPYDETIPELFRKTAIDLRPGQVSSAIRVGAWFHILKHEKTISADSVSLDEVSSQLAADVRERLAATAMEALHDRLLKECRVEIHDPALREAYQQRRRDSSR
ncbi:MAG: peptidylprolyl isomerase, partial [Planctomycetota bacterium]